MRKFGRVALILSIILFKSGPVFSAECNTTDMPEELYQLIKDDKIDKAVSLARAAYDENKNDKQAAMVLARVYVNATLQSGMNIDLEQLGFNEGESGSKSVTVDMLKKATRNSYTVNPDYYNVTDQFITETVSRWPESKSFYYCLTKIHFYSRDHDKFLESLSKTAEFQKNNEKEAVDFLISYGTKFVKRRDYRKAADVYSTLLKTFPSSVPLLSSLGVTYIKRGKTEKAVTYFNKAHLIDSDDAIVIGNIAEASMLMGDFERAESFLLKKAKLSPDRPEIYFDLAMNAMHKGPGSSLRYWNKYFKINEKHPDNEAWVNNAREIQKAAQNKPGDLDLWHVIANQMIQVKVPKFAIPILTYIKKNHPYDAEVEFSMAHAYSVGENTDLEKQALLRTLELAEHPKNQFEVDENLLYYNISRSFYVLDEHETALDYLENISSDAENAANADYLHGLIYRDRGDLKMAKKYFQSCIEKAGDSSIGQYCRGQL